MGSDWENVQITLLPELQVISLILFKKGCSLQNWAAFFLFGQISSKDIDCVIMLPAANWNLKRRDRMKKILIHGSGHKAASWNETISYMENKEDLLCPNLFSILNNKEANYTNLYSSFVEYCNQVNGQLDLCGISLGGILALNYALDFPDKINSLILIGTPHKVPRIMFSIQNMIFRFLPKSFFEGMEFNKNDIFILGNSMKRLDFSDKVQNIRCRTLIICGEKDRVNLKSAYYFTEHIKNAELKLVENTGHIVNEENPEVLARILNEYYK
jgi:pimeloyl-ACP methyl ester carboxylesterase